MSADDRIDSRCGCNGGPGWHSNIITRFTFLIYMENKKNHHKFTLCIFFHLVDGFIFVDRLFGVFVVYL